MSEGIVEPGAFLKFFLINTFSVYQRCRHFAARSAKVIHFISQPRCPADGERRVSFHLISELTFPTSPVSTFGAKLIFASVFV